MSYNLFENTANSLEGCLQKLSEINISKIGTDEWDMHDIETEDMFRVIRLCTKISEEYQTWNI